MSSLTIWQYLSLTKLVMDTPHLTAKDVNKLLFTLKGMYYGEL